MQKRTLGTTRWELPTIGLGCMGLSEFYGPPMEKRSAIHLLHEAIDLGVEHFDTAEMYGIGGANETLLGEAFADRRDKVFIATKFGPTRDSQTGEFTGLDGSPENCRRAIEASLQRLRTDHVVLYYLHRVDPIRHAAKIHPIAAVQSEYSIFSRDIEVDVIPACLEVGASLVAYSPLGRGILTGRFRAERLCEGDWRSTTPRFQGEAYAANLALAEELEAVALAKSCTPAQIALAWVIANLGACDLELSHTERITLDALAARVLGDRYDTWGMAGING